MRIRLENNYKYIATAHHKNDVAETILINMTKGTGLAGLHGIRNKKGKLIRPLLCFNSVEIDNYINEKILISTKFAETVLVQTSSKSAIEYLQNINKEDKDHSQAVPGMIFLDVDMPVHDGFKFLHDFESLPDFIKDHCKVVLLTNSINPKDIERAKESPYLADYVNKPLSEEILNKL